GDEPSTHFRAERWDMAEHHGPGHLALGLEVFQGVERLLAEVAAGIDGHERVETLLAERFGQVAVGQFAPEALRPDRDDLPCGWIGVVVIAGPPPSLPAQGLDRESAFGAHAEGEDRHRVILLDPRPQLLERRSPIDAHLLADELIS